MAEIPRDPADEIIPDWALLTAAEFDRLEEASDAEFGATYRLLQARTLSKWHAAEALAECRERFSECPTHPA